MIARWIDLGAPAGEGELIDTQKPTLHLAAIVEGGAVTELRVGTVDVPSGIDPASLVVCVVGPDDTCGPNLAPPAEMHGVVAIPAALGDPDVEVEARVSDLAGNTTVVRRTVRWLQGSQQPAPSDTDGGTTTDDGTTGTTANTPTSSTDAATGGPTPGDDGCGCRSSAPPATGLAWLLGLGLLRQRRRA